MAYDWTITGSGSRPATIRAGIYLLIQQLVHVGWTILQSGDGIAAYSNSGSVFTNGAATGANGWSNQNSWAILESPDSVRQIKLFMSGSGESNMSAGESLTGWSGSGAATAPPTDPIDVMEFGGNNAQWQSGGTAGNIMFDAMATTTAPYIFYLNGRDVGTPTQTDVFLCCDYLQQTTPGEPASNLYCYWWGGNVVNGHAFNDPAQNGTMTSRSNGNYAKGNCFCEGMINGQRMTSSTNGNPYQSSEHDLSPFNVYANGGINSSYKKGQTSNYLFDPQAVAVNTNSVIAYPPTTPQAVMLVDSIAIPWNGTTPTPS